MHTEQKTDKSNFVAFMALLTVLVPLELVCASLAYHTVGGINSSVLKLAVGLNILPVALYAFKHRTVATTSALALALLLVPAQVRDGLELFIVQEEAARVVTYTYSTKLKTGDYPVDISGYKFRNIALKPNISYYFDRDSKSFTVRYYNTNHHTDHWYRPSGGWGYYDD